jgi:hypothetical protein
LVSLSQDLNYLFVCMSAFLHAGSAPVEEKLTRQLVQCTASTPLSQEAFDE